MCVGITNCWLAVQCTHWRILILYLKIQRNYTYFVPMEYLRLANTQTADEMTFGFHFLCCTMQNFVHYGMEGFSRTRLSTEKEIQKRNHFSGIPFSTLRNPQNNGLTSSIYDILELRRFMNVPMMANDTFVHTGEFLTQRNSVFAVRWNLPFLCEFYCANTNSKYKICFDLGKN